MYPNGIIQRVVPLLSFCILNFAAGAETVDDVIALSKKGAGEPVLLAFVDAVPQFVVGKAEIEKLSAAGVPAPVVLALIRKGASSSQPEVAAESKKAPAPEAPRKTRTAESKEAIISRPPGAMSAVAEELAVRNDWVEFEGKDGPGNGKHIVFVTGDDQCSSEEGMPILARILAEKHGFKCTVLFSINRMSGALDGWTTNNIPGLEALDNADLMVIFTRFRALPDSQMKHIVDFVDSGRPVIGLRTATHAFNFTANDPSVYKKYNWDSKAPGFEGGALDAWS